MNLSVDLPAVLGNLIRDLERAERFDLQARLLRKAVVVGEDLASKMRAQASLHSTTIPATIGAPRIEGAAGRVAVVITSDPSGLEPRHLGLPGLMEFGSKGSDGSYIRHPHKRGSGGRFVASGGRGSNKVARKHNARTSDWSNQPAYPFMRPVALREAPITELLFCRAVEETFQDLGRG